MRVGVILSAGSSERFGSPKIVFKVKGKPMLQWVIDLLRKLPLDERAIVVNPYWKNISGFFDFQGFKVIVNEDFEEGIASSVRKAVEFSKKSGADEILIFLGDMPFLKEETVYKVINFKTDKPIVAPSYKGIKGFPTLIKSVIFDEVLKLKGDVGVKKLIREKPYLVQFVEVDDSSVIKDIDRLDGKNKSPSMGLSGGGGGIRTHE